VAPPKAGATDGSPAKAPGVFEALGEPVRRRILELLAGGEQPVGPLVLALRSRAPISQPAVSQHLRVLLEAGLVSVRAAGTRRLYALDSAGLDAARTWLDRLADPLAPFAQPLDALATEVARGRRATRASRSGGAGQDERPTAAPSGGELSSGEQAPDGQDRRPA
jgi:DNA-binding transcriptional ArsR family regulator